MLDIICHLIQASQRLGKEGIAIPAFLAKKKKKKAQKNEVTCLQVTGKKSQD